MPKRDEQGDREDGRGLPFPGLGPGMITRRLIVRSEDVVFVKGVVEASDGIAQVFAESGGDLTIAAPEGRERDLDELVSELCAAVKGQIASR
jgi:hypothetical protein